MKRAWAVCWLILVAVCSAHSCRADDGLARDLTDHGIPLLAAGVVVNGLSAEGRNRQTIRSAAEAAVAGELLVEGLKSVVHEERPNGGNAKSFPSSHAACAFSLATVLAEDHPRQKWYWYLLACGVAWSRVDLRAHHTHDVLVGAALGHFTAREVLQHNVRGPLPSGALPLLRKQW